MKIAVMQPYFVPYAGYFRLLANVDLFVAFDCVQFPRRGWVHRNKLTTTNGTIDWLTLPLTKGDRDTTRICDLNYPLDSELNWNKQLDKFPVIKKLNPVFQSLIRNLGHSPVNYIIDVLEAVKKLLKINCPIIKSSTLNIPVDLRGQDRILTILQQLGATQYLNAPGGVGLYESEAFRQKGIELKFFSDYVGSNLSILERIANEDLDLLLQEINQNSKFKV